MKPFGKIMLCAAAFSAFAVASCNKEDPSPTPTPDPPAPIEDSVFVATNEAFNTTKTSLAGDNNVSWKEGEGICGFTTSDAFIKSYVLGSEDIYGKYNQNARYQFENIKVGQLKGAMYPSDLSYAIVGNFVTTEFSDSQTDVPDNSFSPHSNLMIAKADSANLAFHNLGGLVKISLGSGAVITGLESVTLSADQYLAGTVTADLSAEVPVATLTGKSKSLTLIPSEFAADKSYYFVVLPGSYTGLVLEFNYEEGKKATYTIEKSIAVSRNMIYTLSDTPFEPVPPAPPTPKVTYVITSQADLDAIEGTEIAVDVLTFKGSGVTDQVWANAKLKIASVKDSLIVDGAAISTTENLIGTSDKPTTAAYIDCKTASFVFKNMSQQINYNAFQYFTAIEGNLVFGNIPNDYSLTWGGTTCFHNIKTIGGSLIYKNSAFNNTQFTSLETVGGSIIIDGTVTGTSSGSVFWNFLNAQNTLTKVGENIQILNNPSPTTLDGFWGLNVNGAIGGNVIVKGNAASYDGQLLYYKNMKTGEGGAVAIKGSCELYNSDGTLYYSSK